MKPTIRAPRVLPLLALTVLPTPLFAAPQQTPPEAKSDAAKQQQDPYGMRTWQLAMLKRGPQYATAKGPMRDKMMKGHFDNMDKLAKARKLRLAGPFVVPTGASADAYAGLFLLDVETEAEARELCKTDPAIAGGLFTVELLTWYGPSDITFRGDLPKPTRLFNGKNLVGWHADIPRADGKPDIAPTFVVRDGLLISKGRPQGHLITDRVFQNYRLVVEYRWPGKPGNCGVLVHASEPRMLYKMFPKSIECQMHHTNAGDFWCIGEDIQVPDMWKRRGPKEKWGVVEGKARRIKNLTDGSEKPVTQWNQMVIECRGREIDVWVNGDHVNHGFGCTADKGQIAIQAEGAVCEFRKIELTPLR